MRGTESGTEIAKFKQALSLKKEGGHHSMKEPGAILLEYGARILATHALMVMTSVDLLNKTHGT
jgi:hypothetical protein